MAGLDKIIDHIKNDADRSANEIIDGAKSEADRIISAAKAEAKKQCDYLIVGVVSDKAVHQNKGENFVPFEERIELVRSCRYVDEAVEIPLHAGGTRDAWHLYHFDVQFSGSDYEHDESWLREKAFLEQHGATMVFFPYTQSTSSTKLKALIEKRLI